MRILIGIVAAAALALAGCQTQNPYTGEEQTSHATRGAILGALGGAAIGALTNTSSGKQAARNALIGAGIGALAGAAIGHYMDQQERNLRERLAGSGVGVTRVSQDRILLNFPADLTFDFDRDSVKSQFVPTLRDVAGVLRDYPQTTIDVLGHADSVGSDAYNQDLSERRAMNVSSVLIQSGVIRQRIIVTGYGESQPIADNSTDSGRARNRRVEVMISAFQG